MASGDRVYVADKATLDSVKTDTSNIKTDTTSIKSTAESILAELKGQRPKRYGYRVKISEGNPSSRVEYLFDAKGMTPAAMNFSAGAFSYGDWANVWFVRDNYPVMLRYDGTEDYRLDLNDYTKKLKDGSASDVASTAYNGNAMSAIPLIWVCRYEENGYQYVIFCEEQYDESYKAYAHTKPDGTIAPYAYHAIYEGSVQSGKLRSISGLAPTSSTTATQEVDYAKANNTSANWNIRYWSLNELIYDMLVMISKSTDVRGAFGQGHTTGGSSAADLLTTGTLNDKGQFFGYSATTYAVKVFHIENFWADRWERVVGCIYENAIWKVKMTPEGNGYNLTGAGYIAVFRGIASSSSTPNGYVKETKQTEYGKFPVGIGGSDSTYECCYHYSNGTIVAVLFVGGACNSGSLCGRSLAVHIVAGAAGWSFGASLSFV